MALKTVWNVKEGRWVNVPEHWIGHPVFGADLASEKPEADESAEDAASEDPEPSEPKVRTPRRTKKEN